MTMPEPLYLKIITMEPPMGDIKNNVRILAECRCRPWRQAVWREFRNSPIPALTSLSSPCCLRRKEKAKYLLSLLKTASVFTTYNFSDGRTANDNSKLLKNDFRDFLLR